MDLDDLSYSKLVSVIQGDKPIAKDYLIAISKREREINSELVELNKKVNNLKSQKDTLYGGVDRIFQHLKTQMPQVVINEPDNEIITFDNDEIIVQKNIL